MEERFPSVPAQRDGPDDARRKGRTAEGCAHATSAYLGRPGQYPAAVALSRSEGESGVPEARFFATPFSSKGLRKHPGHGLLSDWRHVVRRFRSAETRRGPVSLSRGDLSFFRITSVCAPPPALRARALSAGFSTIPSTDLHSSSGNPPGLFRTALRGSATGRATVSKE